LVGAWIENLICGDEAKDQPTDVAFQFLSGECDIYLSINFCDDLSIDANPGEHSQVRSR
jgi:hypothetical protein